jgi:hypothetical protein
MQSIKYIPIFLGALLMLAMPVDAQKRGKKQQSKASQTAKKKASAKSKKTTKSSKAKKRSVVEKPKAIDPAATAIELSKDTTSSRVVTITSAFKPSLRSAAKINFTAASAVQDTTRIPLAYKVPAQNLFFSYQPVPIKPLAMDPDSAMKWENHQYIKAGYGNYSTPFVDAAFAFGDGQKETWNINAGHVGSKGQLPFQRFSKTNLSFTGIFRSADKHEWTSRAFWNNQIQYKYGYLPNSLNFVDTDLRQVFNTTGIELGLQNKEVGESGFFYKPQFSFGYFSDNRAAREVDVVLKAPFQKRLSKFISFDFNAVADITRLTNNAVKNLGNNLYYIDPALMLATNSVKLHLGFMPSWDNAQFYLLPDITAEASIKGDQLVVMAGWQGYYQKNTYRSLANFNPFIWSEVINQLRNTRIMEQYAGFKGSTGKHLTYNAKLAFLRLYNQPLFLNDGLGRKDFRVLYDGSMDVLRLKAELNYRVQEKFNIGAAMQYQQFTRTTAPKAFGLLPFEVNGNLRWQVLKDLHVKADAFFFDGAFYQTALGENRKQSFATDVNLGMEFKVKPKLSVWLQMNNMLNSRYQRWNQYEVLGFNVLGGVVYSFR